MNQMIWKNEATLEGLNEMSGHCMLGHLGIECIEIGLDYLIASMPVDHRTHQPLGILHGGASVALAESMGSYASVMMIDDISKEMPVGININASHLNSVKSGFVFGKVTPVKLGRRLHVWNIDIYDEADRPICQSRLTVMIVENRN